MSKTVVLSGGGTAGHINPALALAEVLEQRGCKVYFAGTPKGIEARLATQAGLEYKAFDASGFDRAHPATLIKGVKKIAASTKLAKQWFREIKPDVVVGFGGYVCIPVTRAAEQMGIPVVLHEQNSVMGMANKYLTKHAQALCLTYKDTTGADTGTSTFVTGNPVRAAVTRAKRKDGLDIYGIPEDATVLLAFGGSLGARHINQAIAKMKPELLNIEGLHVVHITGPKELDSVESELDLSAQEAERWHVLGYQDRMPETLACADLIVSRAGATSLAEISALKIPAVLVPYPFATGDHQTKNAQGYVASGAAVMFPDDELDSFDFAEKVIELAKNKRLRDSMSEAAHIQGNEDSASALADIVLKTVK